MHITTLYTQIREAFFYLMISKTKAQIEKIMFGQPKPEAVMTPSEVASSSTFPLPLMPNQGRIHPLLPYIRATTVRCSMYHCSVVSDYNWSKKLGLTITCMTTTDQERLTSKVQDTITSQGQGSAQAQGMSNKQRLQMFIIS
jgi:hypothetical protein